jgi:Protein of unknown function (DUF3828)
MKKTLRNIALTLAAAIVGSMLAVGTHAQDKSEAVKARAVVAILYKAKPSPFFQTKNRAALNKYFTKQLADLIWKDAKSSNGEVGAIDGDPLYNAQDTEIKKLVVGGASVKGEAATVLVTFTNFGKKQAINYLLKKTTQGWRIDDIKYSRGESLRKWLTSPA